MPAIVNVPDILKIGIMAFVFVSAANHILRSAGAVQFTTGGK